MSGGWAAAVAIAGAGGAACLACPGDRGGRLARLAAAGDEHQAASAWIKAVTGVSRRSPPGSPVVAASGALLAGLAALVVPGAIVAAALIPVGLVAIRVQRQRVVRRAAAARRTAVIELCQCLVPELLAGRTPAEALARAGTSAAVLVDNSLAAATSLDDVPAALQAASRQPGAEALAGVAACWQVAQRHGGGLAAALRRLADSLRAEEALRREVAAQLASARATARLLAALPALGLLLGSGLGGRPVDVLLHTPYGMACAVVGIMLQLTGMWWTDRIAIAAERRA